MVNGARFQLSVRNVRCRIFARPGALTPFSAGAGPVSTAISTPPGIGVEAVAGVALAPARGPPGHVRHVSAARAMRGIALTTADRATPGYGCMHCGRVA